VRSGPGAKHKQVVLTLKIYSCRRFKIRFDGLWNSIGLAIEQVNKTVLLVVFVQNQNAACVIPDNIEFVIIKIDRRPRRKIGQRHIRNEFKGSLHKSYYITPSFLPIRQSSGRTR